MMKSQEIQGISSKTINLVIGGIALLLGPMLMVVGVLSHKLSPHEGLFARSISHYYCYNDVTGDIFVGSLSAVGMLMLCYRGWSQESNMFDRLIGGSGCIAALLIANLPCCSDYKLVALGHGVAAGCLFLLLALMLIQRFTEVTGDEDELSHPMWKSFRNLFFKSCGYAMGVATLVALILIGIEWLIDKPFSFSVFFVLEQICLALFGLGWLAKSRYLFGYKYSKVNFLYWTVPRERLVMKLFPKLKEYTSSLPKGHSPWHTSDTI
jgi:hypothetical protein